MAHINFESGTSEDCYSSEILFWLKDAKGKISEDQYNTIKEYYVLGGIYVSQGSIWEFDQNQNKMANEAEHNTRVRTDDCEVSYVRYKESRAMTGSPVPLESVENLDARIDTRALAAYAKACGVSTLELTKEERIAFLLPKTEDNG